MTQVTELKDSLTLYKPELFSFRRDGIHFFMFGEGPNWIATGERGARILQWVDSEKSFGEIVSLYSAFYGLDMGKSWRDVYCFIKEALRKNVISTGPNSHTPYLGRSNYLQPDSLKEFWMHIVQTCNLSCKHCLVSSGPQGAKGADTAFYMGIIDQVYDLGVRRFYFTGGEPFIREDIFDLIRYVTENKKAELIILTNATLFSEEKLKQLEPFDRHRLKFQVSLDGVTPEINDPIRGVGVFVRAAQGLTALSRLDFETSLTAVVTKTNIYDLENLPLLAHKLGAKAIHLMWLHKRGRILEAAKGNGHDIFPTNTELLALVRKVNTQATESGVLLDNYESLKLRANGQPFIKYDLGNLCWESLCLYIDGHIYPSAAMAGETALSLGDARQNAVKSLWLDSSVSQTFRSATVAGKAELENSPFRFIAGGGDIEHSYFFSSNGKKGDISGEDPYYELYVETIKDIMTELALNKKKAFNVRSGFNPPVIYHAMGDDAIACSEDALTWLNGQDAAKVKLLHSNCVLSFEVEKPYRILQEFYGKAAVEPKKELCCPVSYDESEVGHIPREVIERFYGCGSPVAQAKIQPGETMLDLGSGAGIDCFIAAKKVGSEGKVIGIDMTDEMLKIANECKRIVVANLGYDVVEFKRGYLENVPVPDKSVDVVTSNCVINLSPDKNKVFAEIWRILKDNGRMVVADIVSDRPVPLSLQAHRDLWGECISGALSEDEFVSGMEKAGFYGISIIKKTLWKELEGYKFYSITVRGFKFEKQTGCRFIGQKAVYMGPYKAVIDEEGHLFPRGEAVEICTDTAVKLKAAPYNGYFTVIEADGEKETACCATETTCCSSNSGACC